MNKFIFLVTIFILISHNAYSQTINIHSTDGTVYQFNLSEIDSISFSMLTPSEEFLVDNGEIAGWSYLGNSWVANTIAELAQYINGASVIYQRYGFVDAAYQAYQGIIDNGNRQINLTIYNQGTEVNALALYEDPDLGMAGATNWENGAGQSARYIRYGLSQSLSFYRDSYYISLESNFDSEETLNLLKQFALTVDGKIQ